MVIKSMPFFGFNVYIFLGTLGSRLFLGFVYIYNTFKTFLLLKTFIIKEILSIYPSIHPSIIVETLVEQW